MANSTALRSGKALCELFHEMKIVRGRAISHLISLDRAEDTLVAPLRSVKSIESGAQVQLRTGRLMPVSFIGFVTAWAG